MYLSKSWIALPNLMYPASLEEHKFSNSPSSNYLSIYVPTFHFLSYLASCLPPTRTVLNSLFGLGLDFSFLFLSKFQAFTSSRGIFDYRGESGKDGRGLEKSAARRILPGRTDRHRERATGERPLNRRRNRTKRAKRGETGTGRDGTDGKSADHDEETTLRNHCAQEPTCASEGAREIERRDRAGWTSREEPETRTGPTGPTGRLTD